MANTIGDYGATPVKAMGNDTIISRCVVAIGASGAATVDGDQGWTCTKSTAGVYTVGFPPVAANSRAVFMCGVQLSAALTVVDAVPTALSLTAGTATVKTLLADTAAEPASGDYLWMELHATRGGAGA